MMATMRCDHPDIEAFIEAKRDPNMPTTGGSWRTYPVGKAPAARTVTLQQGATAADTAAQRIFDAYALTANVPFVQNGWYTVQNNDYFQGFANNTDIIGAAYGYVYS